MTDHISGRRRVAVGLATMAVGTIGLVGAFPSAAGATGGDGDHPCPDEGWDFHWGPDNQDEVPGEHTDGDFTVTISNVRDGDEGKTFDFETSAPVSLIFARGYPRNDEGVTHEYDPAVTEGTAWTGDPVYIKHVYFCPGETPPSTESTTTTTEAPTTTTTEATTTTVVPPTEPPPTAPPPSVEPTTPPTEPPTTIPPTTQPVADEELPRTGSTTMPLVAGAGALLAVGIALVVGRRYLQSRTTA